MSGLNPFEAPQAEIAPFRPAPNLIEAGLPVPLGTRLGGRILDSLLLSFACIPGVLVLAVVPFDQLDPGDVPWKQLLTVGSVMLLGVLALQSYQWWLVTNTGQTLAKKWLGMRIVKLDGSPVGFVDGVVLRGWVLGVPELIPYVGILFSITDALFIFGAERRCLHDHIAGTRVVTTGEASSGMGLLVPTGDVSGAALAAGYLGLLGIVMFPLAPVAIILGVLGLRRIAQVPGTSGRGRALTGIVLGALSTLGWAAILGAA